MDEISELEARIRNLVARRTSGYSKYAKLILLLLHSKIPIKMWSDCKSTPQHKAPMLNYANILCKEKEPSSIST